ncbi:hypothetical protein FIU84_20640 [Stutzerimonas frequens]|nr:hypothetical protein FIU84_20640 [Stutzerimonas frequens]
MCLLPFYPRWSEWPLCPLPLVRGRQYSYPFWLM